MINTVLVSIAVLLRIFSNPLGNVFQKQLSMKGLHPLFVNFMTYFLLSVLCLMVTLWIQWTPLSGQFWLYSILVGITGALGNGFLVKALQKGELSVLGPVNSYKSLIGMIGGIILLGEIPGFFGLLGIALIIFGSYFVLDTTEERFSFALLKNKEIQYRLFAMVMSAIEAVFLKKVILSSSAGPAFMSWCFSGCFFSLLLLFVYRLNIKKEARKIAKPHIGKFLYLILCIGTMQYTTNYAFEQMPVAYALSLFQLSTIVSVLLGYRLFRERDIYKKSIGSMVMIAGSIVLILMKNY